MWTLPWLHFAGMMSYADGLKLLAEVENPRPADMPEGDYQLWLADLIESKYTYVVASQVAHSHVEGQVYRSLLETKTQTCLGIAAWICTPPGVQQFYLYASHHCSKLSEHWDHCDVQLMPSCAGVRQEPGLDHRQGPVAGAGR